MKLKNRSIMLHTIGYVLIVLAAIFALSVGYGEITLYSDAGAKVWEGLLTAVTFKKLLPSFCFVVLVALAVAAIVILCVTVKKTGRKKALWNLVHIALAVLVSLFLIGLMTGYDKEIAKFNAAYQSEFLKHGTGSSAFALFGSFFVVLFLVAYYISFIFLYCEVLAYAAKPVEEYEGKDNELTTEQVVEIVKEELKK